MSRVAGTQYSITSPTRRCAATERELATGEPFVAVLAQDLELDQFVRLDYSAQAWNAGARPRRPLVVLGLWRSTVPEPGAKKRMLIDDAALLDLFEQTGEGSAGAEPGEGSRERGAFRFVLALILLRKRLLIQEGSKGRTMLVRPKGTPRPPEGPDLIEVEDPGLDEATIVRVTELLGSVLSDPAASGTGEASGSTA